MYEKGFKHCFYKIVQRQDTFVLKIVARNREMTLALQLFCEHKRSSGIVLLYVHLYSSIRRPSTYRTTVKPHIPSKTSRPMTITSPPYYHDAPIVRHSRTYRSDRSGIKTSHVLTLNITWYNPPGPTLIWRVPPDTHHTPRTFYAYLLQASLLYPANPSHPPSPARLLPFTLSHPPTLTPFRPLRLLHPPQRLTILDPLPLLHIPAPPPLDIPILPPLIKALPLRSRRLKN